MKKGCQPGVTLLKARFFDFAFPCHSHDFFVFGFIEHGAQVSRYGRMNFDVQAGDVIFVNPGETHDGRPAGWCGRTYSMLYFEPEVIAGLAHDSFEISGSFEIERPVTRGGADLLSALQATFHCQSIGDKEGSSDALLVLLESLAERKLLTGARIPQADLTLGDKAHRLLDEVWRDSNAISLVAKQLDVSRFQLRRSFLARHGLTPQNYRRQRRVHCAERLIRYGWTPASAAYEAGFADQSHLTREFRRLLGVSPGALARAMHT